MKKLVFALGLLILLNDVSHSQAVRFSKSFKVTGGRIILGTGDIFGYAANIEWTKGFQSKRQKTPHFEYGGELSFEHASTEPTVVNPTVEEVLFGPIYRATTNIVLSPKLTYYPFSRTFAKGINITGALCFGYTSQGKEFQATRIYDTVSQISVRRSYLEFNKEFIFGYKITAGYEWYFKKILIGARLDFASYTNSDIDTFYGLKLGWKL
jgi:hypothetical protein